MHRPESDEKLEHAKRQAKDLQRIMVDNVNNAIGRGERLELLEKQSEELESSSRIFESKSSQLKRFFCVKNLKSTICIIFIVLVIIAILFGIIYSTTH